MNIIAEILERMHRFGLEAVIHRYYGIYQGKVIKVADPDNMGKVQVAVPAVTGSDTRPIEDWAYPITIFSGQGYGAWFPPEIGDWVWIFFDNGDPSKPIYIGGWFGDSDIPDEMGANPPKVRGIVTPKKNKILISDRDGAEYIEINLRDGEQKIKLDSGAKTIEIIGSSGSIKLDMNSGKIVLESSIIELGEMSTEAAILGTTFLSLLNAHQHIGNLGFPTGPVMVPIPPSVLSTKVKVGL
jgi:hypothetical protein